MDFHIKFNHAIRLIWNLDGAWLDFLIDVDVMLNINVTTGKNSKEDKCLAVSKLKQNFI